MSQNVLAVEQNVVEALAISTIETQFDSSLLLVYFNLDLDQQIAQKMMINDIKSMGTQALMMGVERLPKTNGGFNELERSFPTLLGANRSIKEKGGGINPLPAELKMPPLVQPPVQSNTPDPLSLLMLGMGGVALLGWSRRKRSKDNVRDCSMAKYSPYS
ncbi:hypothetical protein MNBD_GAMMA04-388 [hydrothermal vent metagenome]|uniref:PEP-CTERM protein-sorting domain-containing protein n=1 Tax=hydrothermal vent metagenome TaxID=652676 RepID=A0A3B0WER8_9ZZZZ